MKRLITLLLSMAMTLSLAACTASSAPVSSVAPTSGNTAPVSDPAKKVLRVAMECGYAPYNWTQATNANGAVPIADSNEFAYGYDVAMAKLLAEKLGYELQIVKLDWDSLVMAVQSGTVDCVIAGQSITSDRLQMVDFTTPYYYASIVGLTKKSGKYATATGLSQLSGAHCTSQMNTVWYDACLPQIKDAVIDPAMESAPAMLVALDSGRIDLVVTDAPTAMAACVAYPDMTVLDFTGKDDNFKVSEEEINIGMSLQKGNTVLKDALNSVLATLKPDDFKKMMNEAIAVQPLSK